MAAEYPNDIQVFLDGEDITYFIFEEDTFNPDSTNYIIRNIDLTAFVQSAGVHTLRIVAGDGNGRVDARFSVT